MSSLSRTTVHQQILIVCRRILNAIDRDPYSPAYGCFDRRFWGWKLVDFPEATYQRNISPLAWCLKTGNHPHLSSSSILFDAVCAGLGYTVNIQHKNGSYDQAFPNEQSYGATAFLANSLLKGYKVIKDDCAADIQSRIEQSLLAAYGFLIRHNETHGVICNHLAGAILSLLEGSVFFNETRFKRKAERMLEHVLELQSPEGWFPEYGGADPGYLSLCLHYLAGVYRKYPDQRLMKALDKTIDFLSYFIHPDGSFGGEYGSRGTSVFYPGGFALLRKENMLADRILDFMTASIENGRTVTANDVDTGNIAPLLENYIQVIDNECGDTANLSMKPFLPWEQPHTVIDFIDGGISVRANESYYSIIGTGNGGVIKVFDKKKKQRIYNDCGYAGRTNDGTFVTTQKLSPNIIKDERENIIKITVPFVNGNFLFPTPWKFLLLRLMNLTVMKSPYIGNKVKSILVRHLITGKKSFPMKLTRLMEFKEKIHIKDTIRIEGLMDLQWLECGRSFFSIHMASARYFPDFITSPSDVSVIDIQTLMNNRSITREIVV